MKRILPKMSDLQINQEKLSNGLRVTCVHLGGFHSITSALIIKSGSRYENEHNNGVAHLLEHLVFKGTKKFPTSALVSEAIEGVGGHLNAWTAYDHTAYWNTVPRSQFNIGLAFPFELALSPLLRAEDLERERGVVIEEIRMVQDEPSRLVDDLASTVLYPNHPLGNQILGTEKTIKHMNLDQVTNYRENFYRPDQAAFVVVGNLKGLDIKSLIKRVDFPASNEKPPEFLPFSSQSERAVTFTQKSIDQTHFILSTADPSLGLNNKKRFTAGLLAAILGYGMSSRLFLNIREKRGLAYAISAYFHAFEDNGSVSIYAGVNSEKAKEALGAIKDALSLICQELVGEKELQQTKNQIIGSYDLASDEPLSLVSWYGSRMLLGAIETYEEAKAAVQAVTAEQIRDLAREVFDEKRLTLAAVGPQKGDSIFRQVVGLSGK